MRAGSALQFTGCPQLCIPVAFGKRASWLIAGVESEEQSTGPASRGLVHILLQAHDCEPGRASLVSIFSSVAAPGRVPALPCDAPPCCGLWADRLRSAPEIGHLATRHIPLCCRVPHHSASPTCTPFVKPGLGAPGWPVPASYGIALLLRFSLWTHSTPELSSLHAGKRLFLWPPRTSSLPWVLVGATRGL